MTQTDTFGDYVVRRLKEWGREFSLSKKYEYLGYCKKNILQVLIEHRGEMPSRAQGYKPLELSLPAMQIERIIYDIAKDQPRTASALRAYYCGSGRPRVERYETALLLISATEDKGASLPTERQYLSLVETGRVLVRGALIGLSLAA